MSTEDRDDMELLEHTAPDGKVYVFRLLQNNMKSDDKEGYYCQFPVYEKVTHKSLFIATFRLKSDEIDRAYFKTCDKIDEYVNNLK